MRCQTLWRLAVGMKRVQYEGLDYAGLEIVMRRCGVVGEQADVVFEQLQILEDETLIWRNKE